MRERAGSVRWAGWLTGGAARRDSACGGCRRAGEAISFFRGLLFVAAFELGHVSGDVIGRGPALHQVAEHFSCAVRPE